MNRAAISFLTFFVISLIFTGCNSSGGSSKGTTAPVTITFPGGKTCTSGNENISFEAWVETEQGSGYPMLNVKICITCSGTGLSGITGITGQLEDDVQGIPPTLNGVQTFTATNQNGCTTKRFRRVPSALAGKKFRVTVVDSSGGKLKDDTVEIEDRL